MNYEDTQQPIVPDVQEKQELALVRLITDILTRNASKLEDPPPEILQKVAGADVLYSLLWSIREMVYSLSSGDLSFPCKGNGCVIGELKELQSDLRHLTWQADCIAKGEYGHRVSFPGDFARAFNNMAEKLEQNVSALTKMSEEYKDLSSRDYLTGLYNRRAFAVLALHALENGSKRGRPSSLIMADIDHFKLINDKFGHTCGDDVLHGFAEEILSSLRAHDICCRYGGEEFLMLLPTVNIGIGYNIAERLRKNVEKMTIVTHGQKVQITASFGVSECPQVIEDQNFSEALHQGIEQADKCLYQAKGQGRNLTVAAGIEKTD